MRSGSAFTLVELLVVVAVIAILAAIAVPNFLEAQTRSKVSAVKATMKTGTTALDAYAVDNNHYPSSRPRIPSDPLGLLAGVQLAPLSTPIAYIASADQLRDVFGNVRIRALVPTRSVRADHFPEIQPPNPNRNLLYFHYRDLAARMDEPSLSRSAAALLSLGPDQHDSAGAYVVAEPALFHSLFSELGLKHPVDSLYDPTNGTISEGDIPTLTGDARSRWWP